MTRQAGIGAELTLKNAEFKKSLRDAEAQVKAFRSSAKSAAGDLDAFGAAGKKAGQSMGKGGGAGFSTTAAQAAYAIDDLQYGLRGITNNIMPLMAGLGPMGIAIGAGLTIAAVGGQKLYESLSGAKEEQKAVEAVTARWNESLRRNAALLERAAQAGRDAADATRARAAADERLIESWNKQSAALERRLELENRLKKLAIDAATEGDPQGRLTGQAEQDKKFLREKTDREIEAAKFVAEQTQKQKESADAIYRQRSRERDALERKKIEAEITQTGGLNADEQLELKRLNESVPALKDDAQARGDRARAAAERLKELEAARGAELPLQEKLIDEEAAAKKREEARKAEEEAARESKQWLEEREEGMRKLKKALEDYKEAQKKAAEEERKRAGMLRDLEIKEARAGGKSRKAERLERENAYTDSVEKYEKAGFSRADAEGMARRERRAADRERRPGRVFGAGHGGGGGERGSGSPLADYAGSETAMEKYRKSVSRMDAFKNEKPLSERGVFTQTRSPADAARADAIRRDRAAKTEPAPLKMDPAVVSTLNLLKDTAGNILRLLQNAAPAPAAEVKS